MGESRKAERLAIIEWRPGGHRLAYVRALVLASNSSGATPTLVTDAAMIETPEYRTHLADLVRGGSVDVNLAEHVASRNGLRRELRWRRNDGWSVVLPEADRYLDLLLVAKVMRRLPRPISVIVMRPPGAMGGGARSHALRLAKAAMIRTLLLWPRTVDVHLLENPLATSVDRSWPRGLRSDRQRLDDPCLLHEGVAAQPVELQSMPPTTPSLAVIGSIDARKRVPEVVTSWARCERPEGSCLIVAGRQTPEVREALSGMAELLNDVVLIDRYLETAEMKWVLEQTRGVVVLYDGAMSSGIAAAAGLFGRWLVAPRGSGVGRLAAREGFGVIGHDSVGGIANAMSVAFESDIPPASTRVPTPAEFAHRVLRTSLRGMGRPPGASAQGAA